MADLYFEDCRPGESFDFSAARPITKDEIVAFATQYDPQPFHLDEAAARQSMLGGLAASGWHSCAILMRLNFDHWLNRTASMGAPGIDEVRWVKPLRPGDTLRVRRTILETRVSKSRPDMGLVAMACDVANDAGDILLTQRHSQMIELRHPQGEAVAKPATSVSPATPAPAASAEDNSPFAGYFEDLVIGAQRQLGQETFQRDAMLAFAREYDPQPFHLDDEAARRSHFGALAASGWQTAAYWMRSVIDARDRAQRELAARGHETPPGGPSPGFTALRWIKPVYVGDTISYGSRVVEKRMTSRKGWGLMFSDNSGVNQHGERVFEFRGSAFIPVRAG